jgi:segregation and condensation protein B
MSENEFSQLPLSVQLEGLLFVASEPVTLTHLAEALDVNSTMVEAALKELDLSLESRGLRLQRYALAGQRLRHWR